ncbi:diacylglycerol/lipid kinase family protein [Brachybacterium fresconis]|uniref:Diacylglycerol kinase family enzyme n=1 Tax=Brachybacterium fresconis TaxID=173363 RepID=A0ABS4YNW6_9MICO|nr:diacylglycerol kinase family protein [Brachybacterium fresconis]MBP2410449.1 diacylglycerol kinase family enzyme [Brachybacterium fresconis]
MDQPLLLLNIVSIIILVVAVVLLAVALRHLARHRREIGELRTTAERHEREMREASVAGGGSDGEVAEAGGAAVATDGTAAGADGTGSAPDRVQQVAVVLNPTKFDDAEQFRTRVREIAEHLEGAEVTFYETSVEDPGRGQARQARLDGADLVIAAGGDGTVRLVASVLAGTDTRMGIIPSGTGNLLARNLDIPLEDPSAAMTAALAGHDKQIDVGWLRTGGSIGEAASSAEQIFLVIAGFGADAEMIGHTDDTMKKRLGWVAYVFGGVRTILGRSVDVVLDFPDGTRHAHKARTVLLGNVGKLPGGFVLMPDATADNGRLEIVVAGWKGAAGFSQVLTEVVTPKLVPRGKFAETTRLSSMDRYQATEVKVATTKAQPVQLDGDTDAEATHLIARIDPGSLRLRVPAGTDSTQP